MAPSEFALCWAAEAASRVSDDWGPPNRPFALPRLYPAGTVSVTGDQVLGFLRLRPDTLGEDEAVELWRSWGVNGSQLFTWSDRRLEAKLKKKVMNQSKRGVHHRTNIFVLGCSPSNCGDASLHSAEAKNGPASSARHQWAKELGRSPNLLQSVQAVFNRDPTLESGFLQDLEDSRIIIQAFPDDSM